MEQLSIAYPSWYILLCLALGALFAWLLYGRNPHFKEKKGLNALLAFLRGASVSLIAFLLLNPIIKRIEEYLKPPMAIIAVDQSSSMASYSEEVLELTKTLEESLNEEFSVHIKSIGTTTERALRDSFSESQTDIAHFLEAINDEYAHLNVQNVVLVTDGIFNKGRHPLYVQRKFVAPVHTIAMGDTTLPVDISVKNLFHNDVAFLGDQFEVEVDVQATNVQRYNGEVTLSSYSTGQWSVVEKKRVNLDAKNSFKTLSFLIPARATGVQRYRVVASPMGGEENRRNNNRNFFVEILDSRKKITIIKNHPHPDIHAIRQWAKGTENVELEVVDIEDVDQQKLTQQDLIICHQIPSGKAGNAALFGALRKANIPILFFLGSGSDIGLTSKVQSAISAQSGNASADEVQAVFKGNFDLFQWKEDWNFFETAPPLISPFAEYVEKGGSRVLAYQKIGKIETEYPLISFADREGRKEAIFTATGIWKWRMADYYQHQSFERFDDFFGSIVQFLALKENKEPFRVKANKNLYDEGERIYFSAELYNNSFENVNEAEVTLQLRSAQGDQYPYTFSRVDDRYALDIDRLPEGNYTYTASTNYGGQNLKKRGQLVVKSVEWEYLNTVAQHDVLRGLSQQSGGLSILPSDVQRLKDHIAQQDAKPAVDYQTQSLALIHLKWLLGLIGLLLSLEWFLRRYFGRY